MESVFPTASSAVASIPPDVSAAFDLVKLEQLLSSALQAKEGAPEAENTAEAELDGWFHLHTLTIDAALPRPAKLAWLWGENRNAAANPFRDAFDTFRDHVCGAIDPLVPVGLVPFSRRLYNKFDPRRRHRVDPNHSGAIFYPAPPPGATNRQQPLLELGTLPLGNGGAEWFPNSSAWDTLNWLHAVLALTPDHPPTRKGAYRDDLERFRLETAIDICWVPAEEGPNVVRDESGEEVGSEIKLLITVKVHCDLKALDVALPDVGNELLGMILHSLLPSPLPIDKSLAPAQVRADALKAFYACLQPAPYLPPSLKADRFRPDGMSCTLHPFQIRTVARLLEREEAPVVPLPLSREPRDPDGWWSKVQFPGRAERVYRRVTGSLSTLPGSSRAGSPGADPKGKERAVDHHDGEDGSSFLTHAELELLPHLVDLSAVRGSMLCEEMGLGKTVEAIALMLLHRHPRSSPRQLPPGWADVKPSKSKKVNTRDPLSVIDLSNDPTTCWDAEVVEWAKREERAFADTRRWDSASELHVTEVAATLVVTPPSLLKQWVAEMQTHAPGLRICVYQGWKSLIKGIRQRRRVDARQNEVSRAAAQKRKRQALREETVRKYARGPRGNKVKSENATAGDPACASVATESQAIEVADEDEEGLTEDGNDEMSLLAVTERAFIEYVRGHDVVITTYNDLATDLTVANVVQERPRRSDVNYKMDERPRSALTMVEWWRVIMDEIQLSSDQSSSSNMVALIPRKNSLAMSGTPAKQDTKDLVGSLRFLRVPTIPFDARLWHRLQQTAMRPAFEGVFREISIRTTKAEVSGELHIPLQSRFVVPIELSDIEMAYYVTTFESHMDLLERNGFPKTLVRNCLYELRQICTHPQVGLMQDNRHEGAHRLNLGRKLMTMSEALEKMTSDHTQEYISETRTQMRKMIRKAQLTLMLGEQDEHRLLRATDLFEKVRESAEKQLGSLKEHHEKLLRDGISDIESVDSDETADRRLTQQEKARRTELNITKRSIRETLLVHHQAWFFMGDVHHVKKEIEQEVASYEQAERIRKELLTEPLKHAMRSIEAMEKYCETETKVKSVDDLQADFSQLRGGILTSDTAREANALCDILDDNALLVWDWRQKIRDLLATPIESEALPDAEEGVDVEDPEKEHYAQALQAQGEVEAYLIAYAAAIADRREMLNEERSLLVSHDTRAKNKRSTRVATERATIDASLLEVPSDVADQAAELLKERQAFRDARVDQDCERPLRSLLVDLSNVAHGTGRAEETAIAKNMGTTLRSYLNIQNDHVRSLDKELDTFRKIFNRRVVYFASLQEISDSVTQPEAEDAAMEIESITKDIHALERKLAQMEVKGRYLAFLGSQGERDVETLRDECIICMGSSDDKQLVLLGCGHHFCRSCFREFRKLRSGSNKLCPQCRTDIDMRAIQHISLASLEKTNSDEAGDQPAEGEAVPDEGGTSLEDDSAAVRESQRAVALSRLKTMSIDTMRDVAHLDMLGDYGSKINFLIKHLLHHKITHPNERHVIFSNWQDSLNIVRQALDRNMITYASFGQNSRSRDAVDQFVKDESIMVFLLHAERESAGLTLTTCSVVHLLEPVLRHSYELQAIGRVDRLGQKKQTSVFCYYTEATVESRILAQNVRTGTSIYLQDDDADREQAEHMPQVVSAAHKGGDLSNNDDDEELLSLLR